MIDNTIISFFIIYYIYLYRGKCLKMKHRSQEIKLMIKGIRNLSINRNVLLLLLLTIFVSTRFAIIMLFIV